MGLNKEFLMPPSDLDQPNRMNHPTLRLSPKLPRKYPTSMHQPRHQHSKGAAYSGQSQQPVMGTVIHEKTQQQYSSYNSQQYTSYQQQNYPWNHPTNLQKNKYQKYYNPGTKFVGKSENGKPVDGIQTFYNGDRFKGKFENGKPKKGKLFYADEWEFEGDFENGKPIFGTLTNSDGDYMYGEFDPETMVPRS